MHIEISSWEVKQIVGLGPGCIKPFNKEKKLLKKTENLLERVSFDLNFLGEAKTTVAKTTSKLKNWLILNLVDLFWRWKIIIIRLGFFFNAQAE